MIEPLTTVETEVLTGTLRDSLLDECGAGSDMQGANPEWDEMMQAVTFIGEGSIDVRHAVDEVVCKLIELRGGAVSNDD